tara:strand:+ start:15090 stop:15857 length:768 start_codon:yes stop_codon:yes gene_type:complete
MPNPNLEVSLLKPEEAEQYVRVRHETFKHTINKILYSRGEASQKTLDRVAAETRENIAKGNLYLKCVDTSTGEVVAAARWRHVKPKDEGAKERTWGEVEAAFADRFKPYDESEPDMLDALVTLFNDQKRKSLGTRPYFVLDTLATLPQHERRGAGSMLVRWGCEKADEAGVVAYVEASPVGAPLYARHGFEPVADMEFDLRRWGGDEVMKFIVSTSDVPIDDHVLADMHLAHAEAREDRALPLATIKSIHLQCLA